MKNAEKKINSFLRLPVGWHYGTGRPPTDDLSGRAIAMARLYNTLGFRNTDAFPGIDGEIMVTAYAGSHCLEITLETDKTYRFSHQDGDNEVCYQEGLSTVQLLQLLVVALQKVPLGPCNSSDLSTPGIMMSNGQSSRIWHSGLIGIPMGPMAYHAFTRIALQNAVEPFALMREDFTMMLPLTQQFSGHLMNPDFQMARG